MKIRTVEYDTKTVPVEINISTPELSRYNSFPTVEGKGRSCYINVYNNFYHKGTGDTGSGGVPRPSSFNTNDVTFGFRTIDIKNPYPKGISKYGENWQQFCENNTPDSCVNLFKKSYATMHYQFSLSENRLSTLANLDEANYGYSSWLFMKKNGSSSVVSNYGTRKSGVKYCKVGMLVDKNGNKECEK